MAHEAGDKGRNITLAGLRGILDCLQDGISKMGYRVKKGPDSYSHSYKTKKAAKRAAKGRPVVKS